MSTVQRTLVLLKPDALQRGLAGAIISRLEQTGLKIVAMKLLVMDQDLARKHYAAHVTKPFYPGLEKFITSSPIVAMVLEGREAVEVVRKIMGKTDAVEATPGTIRGDLGLSKGMNLVHGSDSPKAALDEIALYFSSSEIVSYRRDIDRWITEE